MRRVIDVSGDGTNNQGPLVEPTRDDVVAKGITINGLPIMLKRPSARCSISISRRLLRGLRDRRAGRVRDPGARARAIHEAIRTKLVLEIAGHQPQRARRCRSPAAKPPRVSCTIGEHMWHERWGEI